MEVATVLTVYGIETSVGMFLRQATNAKVATVLTVYGIETCDGLDNTGSKSLKSVATVLTVYGIETLYPHLQ